MLDAYIIEKIKREQEGKDSMRQPRIDVPRPTHEPARRGRNDDTDQGPKSDRGVVIIEF